MNDFGLKDKVALITGGSRGIGRATALMLAEQGVHIAFCGRTQETLDSTAEEIRAQGVNAWPIRADVGKLEEVERLVAEALAAAGQVDILVNNAVSSLYAPFNEQTDAHWQHHLDVKLMAYIRCIRTLQPHLETRGWGRVVNIGGMTARIVAPLRVTNGIVNAGVANLTKQLASHLAPHNITINCVHPGTTATERMEQGMKRRAEDAGVGREEIVRRTVADIPLGRLIEPRDIASAALWFCSPLADMVTGQCIAVDGGSAASINY